jgi:hypothetical protein
MTGWIALSTALLTASCWSAAALTPFKAHVTRSVVVRTTMALDFIPSLLFIGFSKGTRYKMIGQILLLEPKCMPLPDAVKIRSEMRRD